MKKIIVILLTMVMVFSLAACGGNDETDNTATPPTSSQTEEQNNSTGPATEPITDPSEDSTELPETEPVVIDDKQAMWEKVFSEGTFTMNANSFEMVMEDIMVITLLSDENGKAYMSVSGTVDGEGNMGVALYKHDNETAYFHTFGSDVEQNVDQWYLCEITNEDDDTTLDETMDGAADTNEITGALESIEKIVYIESIGDIDYIDIYYIPAEDDGEGWTTTYDATIQVEVDGVVGEFRYTEETSDDGWGESSSSYWETEIEGMDLFDWDFDKEAMVLTKDDQTLNCILVKDHLNTPSEKQSVVMRVEIDSNTYEIKKIITTEDDMEVSIEFLTCENVAEFVEIPENVEETMSIEDAAMEFGMTMFALILSHADF